LFDAIRNCNVRANRGQVELKPGAQHGALQLKVASAPPDFRMARVATEPDPGCDGEDLLEEMETR
jgi:hypothetical protein